MAPYLFFAFVIVPIIEIVVFIKVGGAIGAGPTVALVVAISAFGVWHLRRQGLSTLTRAQAAINRGETPLAEVTDGAVLALAALLMILPGLVTDAVGLLLLVPAVRRVLVRFVTRRTRPPAGSAPVYRDALARTRPGPVIEGEAWEVEPGDDRGDGGDRPPPANDP